MKVIDDCLTEKDNKTYSLARILLATSVIFYVFLSTLDVIRTKDFEYQSFGLGIAAILAAGNAGVAFQSKTEHDKPEDNTHD